MFKHIISLRMKYFDNTPIGTLVTRSISDIETTFKYIKEQEKQLKEVESFKAGLEQDFFIKNKQVKENSSINLNEYT